MGAERAVLGFELLENYFLWRQNTVAQYIMTRSLLNLCKAEERNQRARVGMWWWEQAVIDLTGEREIAAVAAEADTDGMEK